jgi:hypothetical protein
MLFHQAETVHDALVIHADVILMTLLPPYHC